MAVNLEELDEMGQDILIGEELPQHTAHQGHKDVSETDISLLDSDMCGGVDFQTPPMPVCTSTPNVPRLCSMPHNSVNSVVRFLKVDDSGYSDTLHSTPELQLSPLETSEIGPASRNTVESSITSTPILSTHVCLPGRYLLNGHQDSFTDSPTCPKPLDSKPKHLPSDLPHYKGKQFLRRRSSGKEERLYEISSIWEESESRDSTDEAYFSTPQYSHPFDSDGASQHSDLVESFEHALRHFSPSVPSKLIGRRIGEEKVDMVSELDMYGLDVMSLLLPYLQPVDVFRMCLVSVHWRQVCLRHRQASQLRQQYLTATSVPQAMGKENQVSPSKQKTHKRALTMSSGQLAEIQPLDLSGAKPSTVPTSIVNSSLYDQARKNVRWEEHLRHCPKCRSVSKVVPGQDRGICLNQHCQADFCTRCFANYHFPSLCAPILVKKSKTDSVGSKKSRKNLKRL